MDERSLRIERINPAGGIGKRISDGEMFISTIPTTLLQVFYKIILHSEVIVKIMLDPDDHFLTLPVLRLLSS